MQRTKIYLKLQFEIIDCYELYPFSLHLHFYAEKDESLWVVDLFKIPKKTFDGSLYSNFEKSNELIFIKWKNEVIS